MPTLAQLTEFSTRHWYLILALVVILILLIRNLLVGNKGSISPATATTMINTQDAAILDVSAVAEFAKGHIIGAINVPINGLAEQIGTLKKYQDRPLIVSCRTGMTSRTAVQQLRKAGFTQVYNLQGGVQSWQAANLPLSRKKS